MVISTFDVAGRTIGPDSPPLVIAELGINHGGSLAVAKQMVDAAARAGVEVLKHQTHVVEDEMAPAARLTVPGNATESIYDIMSRVALSEDDERELMEYTQSRGIVFISTPFSRAAAERLDRFGVPAFKIGSGELNHYPLVAHIARYGRPMILSTGMNDVTSVARAVQIVSAAGVPFALMHTTNVYPTPPELVRLGAMQELAAAFPGVPFGLSDHSVNNNACLAAVALGASVLERHFTDRMDRVGPDIVNSMDEAAARELVAGSREVALMRGGTKRAAAQEDVTIRFAFASLVTTRPVRAGETFTEANLWAKRPGTGELLAGEYWDVLGRTATRDIPVDTLLSRAMVDAA